MAVFLKRKREKLMIFRKEMRRDVKDNFVVA
jgi:hypothetical protein